MILYGKFGIIEVLNIKIINKYLNIMLEKEIIVD